MLSARGVLRGSELFALTPCCCWCCEVVSALLPSTGILFTPRWYMGMERQGGMVLTGENWRIRRNTCPNATLSTTNPTWAEPGAHSGLRRERPATNRLSHVTALASCSFVTKLYEPFVMGTDNIVLCTRYISIKISIHTGLYPYIDTFCPSVLPNAKTKRKIQLARASPVLTNRQHPAALSDPLFEKHCGILSLRYVCFFFLINLWCGERLQRGFTILPDRYKLHPAAGRMCYIFFACSHSSPYQDCSVLKLD
jgi:hypothetical protein